MIKMSKLTHYNNAHQWYLDALTSRIVAKSGIPEDRFHLGKIILQSLKETDPGFILQIDGGTGQSENYGSVLKRTVQCANSLRKLGIEKGDVLVLMASNHLDLAIPFYAALYLGIIIAPVDVNLGVDELEHTYSNYNPKIIFCENNRLLYVKQALEKGRRDAKIITFDKSEFGNFSEFLQKFGDCTSVEEFRPTDFDAENTLAILIPTSGTTGPPKAAAVTHKNIAIMAPTIWAKYTNFPTPTRMALVIAPLQWLSSLMQYVISPYIKYPRLQTSLPMTQEHMSYLINTYKPSFMILSPTMMTSLLKGGARDKCDFTCFDSIWMGGSAVHQDLIEEVQNLAPGTEVIDVYGISEAAGVVFQDRFPPKRSCGKKIPQMQYKLVDTKTGNEITDPNVPGELWLKGPGIFKGYYNNPEATKEAIDDGWFKSGDIMYRDENWNYYFVDRFKLLLKYKNHQISPVEVEAVIRKHPSVLDVAVTGIPDQECGDLPVACVVTRPGHTVSAQEIKDLVKDSLAETKQLRGGVIFMSELPATVSTKLHRCKLKELVLTMERE